MTQASGGQQPPHEPEVSSKLLTLPNVLSTLRLLAVPFFLWTVVDRAWVAALLILAASGVTDYLDGKIARHYHQVTRLGQLLDPVADRLYIVSTLIGMAWTGVVPWWLVVVLLSRDGFLALLMLSLRSAGQIGLPVHFVGKAATFCLLYAFPVLLLAQVDGARAVAEPVGWAFAWWGVVLYWMAGVIYAVQAAPILAARRR